MKKVYNKPEILFESFVLSTAIAGNCEQIFTLSQQFVCAIPDPYGIGMNIYNTSISDDCTVDGTGNELYDGFCYHIPTEALVLFSS